MTEVCNNINNIIVCTDNFEREILKKILSETHLMLKHNLKTVILAQIRALEYIMSRFNDNENNEINELIQMSYEASMLQYELIIGEINFLGYFCAGN